MNDRELAALLAKSIAGKRQRWSDCEGFFMHYHLSEEAESSRKLYANLMEEIKRRIDLTIDLLQGSVPIPKIVAQELCFLQMRLICELIALGCLVAHGDIPATRKGKLLKYYAPGDIIKGMEELHANFYPVAGEQIHEPGKPIRINDIKSGFLSKAELLKLWGVCGDALHIGNLKSLLKQKRTLADPRTIAAWITKIVTLLNHHQIALSDGEHSWFVLMKTDKDGSVQVALFKKLEPDADATS